MTIGDGEEIAQSDAMLRYAGKLGGLVPSDLQTELKMNEAMGLETDIYRVILPAMYIGFDSYRPKFGHEGLTPEQVKALQKKLRGDIIGTDEKPGELMVLLKKLDEQLAASTWLAGEQLTIADCQMIPRLVHLSTGVMDHIPTTILDTFANIKTYMANFQAIPQVKAFYDDLETKKKAAEEATKEQK